MENNEEQINKEGQPQKDVKSEEINNNNKEHHFIYFIESHEKSKNIKIYLSSNYKDSNTLEIMEEKDSSQIQNSLISKIFRFKLYPDNESNDKEKEITIIIEDQLKKSEFTFKIKDIHKDFYEYNLKSNTIDIVKLSYEQQFEIYVEFLRKKLKKLQTTKENEEFIISTQLLLEKDYDFLFYLLIFLECFTTKLAYQHLLSFKPEKIKGLGQVSAVKLKQISNILNMLYKKPEKIKVEKEELRDEINESFYLIMLYFILNFQKEKINEMIDNEKMYERIIKNQNIFNNIILSNELVNKLIDKATNFSQVLIILYYLGKDCVNVLQIIDDKKDKLSELILKIDENNEKEDDENEIKIIEFEKYVLTKNEDNLFKMLELINKINIYEATEIKLVKFSPEIIEQYIQYNTNSNVENLRYINQIVLSIKKVDLKFKIAKNLDLIIHDTSLKLIENKKFNNSEILDFISTDDYYQNHAYNKAIPYRPLTVFDGIDITGLDNDNDFWKKWKKCNFIVMFEYQFKKFSEKIASLIKEMKDFELIFKLFNIEIDKDPPPDYVDAIQNRFFEIIDTYDQKCHKFPENVALLICLIDKKKLKIKDFLTKIQELLERKTINDIYITASNLYHEYLSNNTINLIVNFFTKDKTNSEPLNLVNLIQKCKNLRKEIFSNIDKYIIKENDFLYLEESDNYKFYKYLVDKKIIEKDTFKQIGANYISKVKDTISSLENKLSLFEINYGTINVFFKFENNNKLKNKLMDRLLHIYLLNNEKAEKTYNALKSKVNEIKNIILQFTDIFTYFSEFYPNLYSKDMANIGIIIAQLNIDILSSFENNYKDEYINYMKYHEDAIKSLKKKQSLFFNEIFKEEKNKNKNDDKKCLEATENLFKNFKKLFEINGINQISQQLLELCIKSTKEDEKALKKEINILAEIFKIKDNASINEIYNNILLMSKKEYIFNIARSINSFFDILNPIRTNFQNDINLIIKSLQKSYI